MSRTANPGTQTSFNTQHKYSQQELEEMKKFVSYGDNKKHKKRQVNLNLVLILLAITIIVLLIALF